MFGKNKYVRRSLVLFMILMASSCLAGDWVITNEGVSPDKRLAVAIFPETMENGEAADGTVLLIDNRSHKVIGPLEEVDSCGGSWGDPKDNVHCVWSADSHLLGVNFRIGKQMRFFQIYRIVGRRAIPLTLPADTSHPKGRILKFLAARSNCGATVSISKDGTIIKRTYGFMVKERDINDDDAKFLTSFKGSLDCLQFIYRFQKDGRLKLTDIKARGVDK